MKPTDPITRQKRAAKAALWLIVLLFVCGGVAVISGCGVAAGSDPVLVNAEKSVQTAFAAVDTFLAAEHANREMVKQDLPDVHALAERLRRDFPPAHREAVALVGLYRKTRDPDDATAAQAKQDLVNRLASEATAALLKLRERKDRR